MNKLFTYLLALCTATCLYGCSEELEEMTSTEESPSNIVSRSIPESFSCGTIETDPPAWYFNTPRVFNNNSIYTLNIYIHVIRSSSGVGFNKEEVAQTVITNLNGYYASAKINFYLLGSDYIDSDRYNNSTLSIYKEICKQNSHNNAIDIYVLSSGKNWNNTTGIANGIVSSACVIQSTYYTETTVPHELGHCFGLYHTHHGTAKDSEGGKAELVNGSNSATAGDYMTDTPADPCEWNIFGEYIGTGTDANGDFYNPDPKNLMSYNGYYRHKFSAEQIAKMRSIISQREEVSPTIHQKQIIGPKHFSNSGTYSLSVLNADESVRWEVTAYSENGSTKTTYTTSTLTLSSTQPTYYSIVASITSPAGTKSVTTHATCNEPSPYIGSLYWETNQGQYSITDANYRHKFSAEQIAKMRSIISQREEVSPTIHQKQIIGPKHFSNSGTYSLSVLNADESVRWEVTAYSENGSTKTTYTTSTLTLSSTQPTYYSIVASITSPAGTKSVTTHATCNEPSPYIGSLYWETNQGQYSITDATNYGEPSMYPETST